MTEIFSRMDLQQIRAFLLNGEETYETQQATYDERIKGREKAVYRRLKDMYQDELEYENAVGDLYEMLAAYEEV